ncbi:MAG: hypothetical protein PHF86_02025 [Candidatus Nanoarchaeia archaeon]|nr:hypothetical protein [Candidatus Nanoarchaeia archaeon]
MKPLLKNIDGLFICEECGILCKKKDNLSRHIGLKHNKEEYLKKYIIEESDKYCPICKTPMNINISFCNFHKTIFCSKKCQNINLSHKKKNYTLDKKILIENKRKQTCLEKYGVNNPIKDPLIIKKIKQTCLEKYGESSYFKSKKFKDELDNRMNSFYHKKRFLNSNLHYQSSYELDFLEKYYNRFVIENGPTIFYNIKNKEKRYYSDFYVPSLNLIIEIKSSYIYKKTLGENLQKKKYSEKMGYNFLFLLDKNYKKLEKYAK